MISLVLSKSFVEITLTIYLNGPHYIIKLTKKRPFDFDSGLYGLMKNIEIELGMILMIGRHVCIRFYWGELTRSFDRRLPFKGRERQLFLPLKRRRSCNIKNINNVYSGQRFLPS